MLNLDGRSSTIPQLDSEIERRRRRAVKKTEREETRMRPDVQRERDEERETKRDDRTRKTMATTTEKNRRGLLLGRDERREAGSQDAARRIDWVTEIIRTMSDARLVDSFFRAGRRSVSCFRERSDKGGKVPSEKQDTIGVSVPCPGIKIRGHGASPRQ